MRRTRWLMVLVLLAAAVLRLVGLNNGSPPGLAHDEVANWLIDRSILAGEHAIYFTRAYGHEAGFHYLQAGFVALLGDNPLALRLPAAFAGLLGVAVTYALGRRLLGRREALLAAALLAALFWPVFYSRLGLRAILLTLVSGLSAVFWWRAWLMTTQKRRGAETRLEDRTASSNRWYLLSGLFAGLSVHTYMAGRAVPLFYGLFLLYLTLFHRAALRRRWRGVLTFVITLVVVAAPLVLYLQTNPGAEFRISEIDAPLQALRAGDVQPALANGLKLLGLFGLTGDPLWREGVPGVPVFEPVVALLFYAGLGLALWRWREAKFGFLLLWLATAVSPSLVTINAPSLIRSINLLPVLTLFPVLVIHFLSHLSTVFHNLSTENRKISGILVLTILLFYGWRTVNLQFRVWPQGGDVPFVWQAAFTEAAVYLDSTADAGPAALAGWSPDTLDAPTMQLNLRRDEDVPLSHFGLPPGREVVHTLLIPRAADGQQARILRPTALPLDPLWEELLTEWGATVQADGRLTRYTLPALPRLQPQVPASVTFGGEILFLGYGRTEPGSLITYWQVIQTPSQPLRLFLHLLDDTGSIVAEDYAFDTDDPQGLWFPHWQPGDLILQHHPVDAEGIRQARLGWFNPTTCTPGPCQNLLTDSGTDHVLLPLVE